MSGHPPDHRRSTRDGWLPPEVAATLVEYGHLRPARLRADRGDWHCARALADALFTRGEPDATLAVLRPFADDGHWEAVERLADVMDETGRKDEAVALVRRHLTAGGPYGATGLAALLARQGRVGEAIASLAPHVADIRYAEVLVSLTADTGHDDQVASLLRHRIDAERHQPSRWPHMPDGHDMLLATVLERQGRVDEAIALLRERLRHGDAPGDHADQLAGMLARADREADLRALAAGHQGGEKATLRLATWLEAQNRVEEAIAVLRPVAGGGSPAASVALAGLFASHHRMAEAIDVLRRVAMNAPDPEWPLHELCTVLIDHHRPDEALAALDGLATDRGGSWLELRLLRSRALAASGRIEEAISALRDEPDQAWCVTTQLAELLVEAGRPEQAITLLRSAQPGDPWITVPLARLLVRQGHLTEAIDLFEAPAAARRNAQATHDEAFWRQFHADGGLPPSG